MEEKFGRDVKIFSCEMENGSRVRKNMLSLGNGNIVFFPCISCMAEIESQILKPLVADAIMKSAK